MKRYTVVVNGDPRLGCNSRDDAAKAAQGLADELQCWVEVRDSRHYSAGSSYGAFAFNVKPRHKCAHCGEYS